MIAVAVYAEFVQNSGKFYIFFLFQLRKRFAKCQFGQNQIRITLTTEIL